MLRSLQSATVFTQSVLFTHSRNSIHHEVKKKTTYTHAVFNDSLASCSEERRKPTLAWPLLYIARALIMLSGSAAVDMAQGRYLHVADTALILEKDGHSLVSELLFFFFFSAFLLEN